MIPLIWRFGIIRCLKKLSLSLLILAAALSAAFLLRNGEAQRLLQRVSSEPWGPAAFIAAYAASCVLFIPASILSFAAGAIFGLGRGILWVSIGATLGATAAFLTGRYLARDWVAKRVGADRRFSALDEAMGKEGWRIVLLTRLAPIFPFVLLNYALGLTRVTLKEYVLATWVGILPGASVVVYLGSLAGGAVRGENSGTTPAQWAFYALGLAATILLSIKLSRLARKALNAS